MNITNLKTEIIMIYEVAIGTSQSLLANEALWSQAQQYLCSASHGNSSPLLKSKMREEVPISYIEGPCIWLPILHPFSWCVHDANRGSKRGSQGRGPVSCCLAESGPKLPDLLVFKVKVKSLSRVRLLATPWTAAYQAPSSMGFSRQEYWSG